MNAYVRREDLFARQGMSNEKRAKDVVPEAENQ
jgi:hypothetical protein